MQIRNQLTDQLGVDFPMIMAPMFLVSNEAMMKAAIDNGIPGALPSLNYREDGELAALFDALNAHKAQSTGRGTYGVNLIVQETNPLYRKRLEVCVEKQVPFYITSLGNPKEVVERAHSYGAKVYSDVTNMKHARKANSVGCDGFIAVGQGAGGHAGPNPLHLMIPALKREFPDKVVIGAGGIADGTGIASVLACGGDGVSVGTRFIATTEATVSDAYKQAIVDAGMEDIVLSTRISGTPCNIINTPYAQKIGTRQNFIERWLNRNKTTKKWFKTIVQLRGMKKLQSSVMPGSYKTLWTAGQSSELIGDVLPTAEIIKRMEAETEAALKKLATLVS